MYDMEADEFPLKGYTKRKIYNTSIFQTFPFGPFLAPLIEFF